MMIGKQSTRNTSISITAFTAELIEDFGIQEDLQNMVPTTVKKI